jgi:hypothetical protein
MRLRALAYPLSLSKGTVVSGPVKASFTSKELRGIQPNFIFRKSKRQAVFSGNAPDKVKC